MARQGAACTANTFLIWLWGVLAYCSFSILLGGVAALQHDCDSGDPNSLNSAGTVGYLAPVSCDKFYRYTWWITFYQMMVVVLISVAFLTKWVHKSRAALTGLLAIAIVLLMDTANTYLYYNDISTPPLSSKAKAHARVVLAGAIIGIVADIMLLLWIGVHDETVGHKGYTTTYDVPATAAYGTAPTGAATTTGTAGTGPVTTV